MSARGFSKVFYCTLAAGLILLFGIYTAKNNNSSKYKPGVLSPVSLVVKNKKNTQQAMDIKSAVKQVPVQVIGYGVIGSKVAQALNQCGFTVLVTEINPEKAGQAKQDGFKTFDSVQQALSGKKTNLIIDNTPSGVGAKMKEFYGDDDKIIFQGGEKLDIALNYHPMISNNSEISEEQQIRLVLCNTSAMFNIFVPILENFGNVKIQLDVEYVAGGKKSHGGASHKDVARHGRRI